VVTSLPVTFVHARIAGTTPLLQQPAYLVGIKACQSHSIQSRFCFLLDNTTALAACIPSGFRYFTHFCFLFWGYIASLYAGSTSRPQYTPGGFKCLPLLLGVHQRPHQHAQGIDVTCIYVTT
jgi:hypothetical protein